MQPQEPFFNQIYIKPFPHMVALRMVSNPKVHFALSRRDHPRPSGWRASHSSFTNSCNASSHCPWPCGGVLRSAGVRELNYHIGTRRRASVIAHRACSEHAQVSVSRNLVFLIASVLPVLFFPAALDGPSAVFLVAISVGILFLREPPSQHAGS